LTSFTQFLSSLSANHQCSNPHFDYCYRGEDYTASTDTEQSSERRKITEMTDKTLLLRPSEAAELIGVGRTRIYALIGGGVIPSLRIGRSVRVPADGLKDWIARQTAGVMGQADA
jgi:excisionase family DNA binding protein